MQIKHPNFLLNIHFVNIKQTTQLQLVPEDKVAKVWVQCLKSADKRATMVMASEVKSNLVF